MNNTIINDSEFTIRTANKTLPLVSRIVDDIVALSKQVSETRDRLEYLAEGRPDSQDDVYSKELKAIEESTDEKSEMLDQYLQELLSLSVIPTSASQGYVDFLAQRNGEQVCLCWRQGEDEVMFWHRAGENCSSRQLVDLPLIRQSGDRAASGSA